MAVDQDCVVDSFCNQAAVCANVWGHAPSYRSLTPAVGRPDLFRLLASRNFSMVSHYLSLLIVAHDGRNSQSRRSSKSQNMVAMFFFFRWFNFDFLYRGNEDVSVWLFPHQSFDDVTIFISVRGPWSASEFHWIIIHFRSAIFKFVAPYRQFLLAEKVLAVNIH
jgi:hypothetical protein